jgi:AAT family amino acid transporter
VDDAFGFALTWNYWFNDAISVASDLVALQLLLHYWTTNIPGWAISLIFWFTLIAANVITVRAYGEVHWIQSHTGRDDMLTNRGISSNTGSAY